MSFLTVEDLRTYYFILRGSVKAVDGVSFTLERGQSLGIAGESGCGKSTIALSLMRLIKGGRIVSGRIILDGTSLLEMPIREFNRIRWKRISMVSQAAMGALNPVYRIGDQIVEAILTHTKIKKREAWGRAEELLKQVDMDPSRARNYPHELSGGMRQRAMIAMALALSPELIIADEPTTALDMVTQAQVLKLTRGLQEKLNVSLIFISHDLSILGQTCDRIIIMYAGKIVEEGDVQTLFGQPQHPYTRALLSAFPDIKGERRTLVGLPGSPPDLIDPPIGCRFCPRCSQADKICKAREPIMIEIATKHYVACHQVKGVG
jgi:oligopeptide/dipeptide ABC transporter ATP-binding protein